MPALSNLRAFAALAILFLASPSTGHSNSAWSADPDNTRGAAQGPARPNDRNAASSPGQNGALNTAPLSTGGGKWNETSSAALNHARGIVPGAARDTRRVPVSGAASGAVRNAASGADRRIASGVVRDAASGAVRDTASGAVRDAASDADRRADSGADRNTVPTTVSKEIGEAESRDNTLTVGLEALPNTIIPMVVPGSLSGQISAQVFAGVCRLTPEGRLTPYLAKSYAYAPDFKSVRILLREGATFHDGVPITAGDVAFSIRTARRIHAYFTVFEQLREIRIASPHRLTLHFALPQPHFMKALIPAIVPILPHHVYRSAAAVERSTLAETRVGSGPFRPVAYSSDRIVLKRHPRFFLPDRPRLDGITFIAYEKVGELHYGLIEREIDVSTFQWRYGRADGTRGVPHLAHTTAGYDHIRPYFLIQFNLGSPPLDNPRVRKALSLAIDRAFLAKNGFSVPVAPMYGPMVPGDPFHRPPRYDHAHRVREANRLLDAAGLPRDEAGVRMRLVIQKAPYVSQTSAILEFLQYEFSRTIGVELVISTPASSAEWERNIGAGDYSSTIDELFSWHDPFIGFHRLYAASNRGRGKVWANTTGYGNPEVDRLLTRAAMEREEGRRKALYDEVQQLIGADYVSLWLTRTPYVTTYNTRVHGLAALPLSTMSPMDAVHVNGHGPGEPTEARP